MGKKILVVLDPGHKPDYNKGAAPGYYEGNKMYDLSEYERDALKAYGIDVIITRKRSDTMDLYARGQVAVKNAKGYDAVLFISNHSNAYNGKAYGVEVYRSMYLPYSSDLGNRLAKAIVMVMKPETGVTYNRGVKTRTGNGGADYYGVIRGSVSGATNVAQAAKRPVQYSYIIEYGFHDNAKECAFLNKAENLKKIAEAVAKTIAEYFGLQLSGGSAEDKPTQTQPAETEELYRVRMNWDDARTQLGAYRELDNAKKKVDENPGFKVFDSVGKVVYPEAFEPYLVKVTASALNVRKGPSTGFAVVMTIRKGGVYTIVGESNGWGRLKSGAGWIKLSYTKRV